METTAARAVTGDGEVGGGAGWVINGEKTWNTGVHAASHDLIFARTSGRPGDADGITAFLTPVTAGGFTVEEYLWTFNMPTDHARVSFRDVRVPDSAIFGGEGRGLQVVQHFFNENRIRQAASSLGAASTASASRWPTHWSASRSASRSQPTRRSSSRWSSCRPSARCSAR
jgi:alkylation response protein AidB-like acyl-CoA dehydrogenase